MNYRIQSYPRSRIATLDVVEIGKQKHHVSGFFEVDVSESRRKIREFNRRREDKISFTSWMIKVIGSTLKQHDTACAFLKGKNKLMIFEDINVSLLVEKEVNDHKVPIPLLLERIQDKKIEVIAARINEARNKKFTKQDIVLQRKSGMMERFYYYLPGFLRRLIWKFILKHPKFAFAKMGNVAITSLGMMGRVNGWFLPISIHPVCFGIGAIIKKPVVVENQIVVREMLNLSVLLDHDLMDGANMARLISDLVKNIEAGKFL
jgi:pyruvate/2-oxoglutarate dehydrogenase complex dihydrolipoamide acyltransferase (E2) component